MSLVASTESFKELYFRCLDVREAQCAVHLLLNTIMLLYYRTQGISNRMVYKEQKTVSLSCVTLSQQTEDQDQLIRPKKLSNPILESGSHRGLHRELLVSHKWGLLPEEKPELKRVLEQKRRDQHREESSQPPSDLEQELRKRRHKLMQYEQMELRRREELQNVPEFMRVRDNLRHITISSC